MTSPPQVLVINRAQDRTRLNGFLKAAARVGAAPRRIEAVDGHGPIDALRAHSDLLGDTFWERDRIKPGAFACFLSHMLAWEAVARSGHPTLICEDDARLTAPPTPPKVEGLVFANARLTRWRAQVAAADDPALLPLTDLMDRTAASAAERPAGARAPGADSYWITPIAARLLLSRARALGCIAGVDWMMLHICLPRAAPCRSSMPELQTLTRMAGDVAAGPQAFIAPAISRLAKTPSVLAHDLTLPLAALKQSQGPAA